MFKSATQLMKDLKKIEKEIAAIHLDDVNNSNIPMNEDGNMKYEPDYDYKKNRDRVSNLQEQERSIKKALTKFNESTYVEGYDCTVSDALVQLSNLKSEIKVLEILSSRQKVNGGSSRYCGTSELYKVAYSLDDVKNDLSRLNDEYTNLQVAVDKTNLNSSIVL